LARILETWMLAVLGVMNSAWPICWLSGPCTHSRGHAGRHGHRRPGPGQRPAPPPPPHPRPTGGGQAPTSGPSRAAQRHRRHPATPHRDPGGRVLAPPDQRPGAICRTERPVRLDRRVAECAGCPGADGRAGRTGQQAGRPPGSGRARPDHGHKHVTFGNLTERRRPCASVDRIWACAQCERNQHFPSTLLVAWT
jgi:hypothetical protein